jgi:hypothetical protein
MGPTGDRRPSRRAGNRVDGAAAMSEQPGADERISALERENAALRRANAKLMRERLGSSNTAAAGRLAAPPSKARNPAIVAVRSPLAKARLALRRVLLRLLR